MCVQVVQQLLDDQASLAQLERRFGESEAALSAAAEELVALRSLNFGDGHERDENVHAMMSDLHERVRSQLRWLCMTMSSIAGPRS